MREARIRVVVQHPLPLTRDALATALRSEPDIDVVRTVPSLPDVPTVCRDEQPDVVVIHLDHDREAGFAEVRKVSATSDPVRIVCIVDTIDAAGILEAERVGIAHLVSTSVGLDALLDAIREHQSLAVRHLVHVTRTTDDRHVQALTPRELEVLERVATGESRAMIAHALGISAKTVDNHKRNLVVKLGASNQAHAVSIALKRGLL
ncbi:MAG: LuxR C-terminal-related transcriptional regulator [Acidimicrobiia bacterium]